MNAKPRKNGPFTILNSAIQYENPWMRVIEEEVELNGKRIEKTFTTFQLGPAVSVLPIDEDGNVYLIREFRYALGRYDTLVVMGGMEDGETFEAGARRELEEELGIRAEEWIDVGQSHSLSNYASTEKRLFVARNLSFTRENRETSEVIESLHISYSEALEMAMKGEISDASTITLLLRAQQFFEK